MDLASLLLACSVHADDRLLLSISAVFSRGNPHVIVDVGFEGAEQDDGLELVQPLKSLAAARQELVRILSRGGAPVLGLLPVRPEWAEEYGRQRDELFDPCTNISVASAKISEFDYACRAAAPVPQAEARRACTLSRYGSSVGLPGLRRAVLGELGDPDLERDLPLATTEDFPLAPSERSEIFFSLGPVPAAGTWGSAPPSGEGGPR